MVEQHRQAILGADGDPIKTQAANKEFWGRKLDYLKPNEKAANLVLFNGRKHGSYHPWTAQVMGETYGDLELKDFISIKDYLDSPPSIDDFLAGVVVGAEKAQKRRNNKPAGGKDPLNGLGKDIASAVNKGKV